MGFFDKIFGGKKKGGIVPGSEYNDPYGAAPQATMTPQPTVNDWFENHTVVLKNRLRPQEKEQVVWDYKKLKQSEIVEVLTHCGCTAKIGIGSKGISAEFTHTKADVPPGGKPYNFFLTVYKNDGVGKVPDGRGGMRWADHKDQRTLTISCYLLP